MWKKVISLAVVFCVCLSLALVACSSPTPTTAPAPAPAASTPPKTTAAAPAPVPATTTTTPPKPSATTTVAEKPNVKLKFASFQSQTHEYGILQVKAFKELETKTNGRIKVELFMGGSLVAGKDILDATSAGTVDIGETYMPYFSGTLPLGCAHQCPNLYKDTATELRVLADPEYQKMWDELTLTKFGVLNSKFDYSGFFDICGKKQVLVPSDLKGTKMRTFGQLGSDAIQACGGAPVSVIGADIYEALMRGTIDEVLGNTGGIMANYKLEEVAPYYLMCNLFATEGSRIIRKASYDKLTEEDKKLVMDAMDQISTWKIEQTVEREKPAGQYGKLFRTGFKNFHEVTPAEKAEWNKVFSPITAKYRDGLNASDKAWFDRYVALIKKNETK